MSRKTDTPVYGIKIKNIAHICIISCVLLMFIIYFEIARVDHDYQSLINSTSDCLKGQKCAISLERSSDNLTNQVRLFVVEQDPEKMHLYFDEIEGQNRENMVAQLEMLYGNTEPEAVDRLKNALHESKELERLEVHAMCLVSHAMGLPKEELPEAVASWNMTPEEKAMTEEELIEKAHSLVYGARYLHEKQQIKSNTQETLDLLTGKMEQRQNESGDALQKTFSEQKLFIFLLMVLVCAVFLVIGTLIVYPVSEHVRSIQANKKWRVMGIYEMRYLACIYNQLYDNNEVYKKELEYKATHDALTGIYNRAAFERKKADLVGEGLMVALLLADVNKFKRINDTLGHEVGDKTLKKVARVLDELKLENKCCVARIGGDEFAVLFQNIRKESFPAIKEEIQRINEILGAEDGDVPKVSISVGVAFSENGYSNELFRQADQALYYTKSYRYSDCSIYEDALKAIS